MKKILLLLFFCSVTLTLKVNAQQCLGGGCTGGGQFPAATQTSTTSNWSTVSTIIYAGDYGVYSVTSGSTYEWSLCSSDGGAVSYDAQLTLLNSTGSAAICFSDDYCETNKPKIKWTATFTGTVRVLVAEYNCITNITATKLVWHCLSCGTGSAPVNDNCANATALTVGASCSNTAGTVANATNSLVSSCVGTADDDVWYKFTTSTAGYYTIKVAGSSNFDAVVDLRSGACNGINITCADNTLSGGTEVINAMLSASTTYYVRVYDYYSTPPSTPTFNICVYKPTTCEPSYTYGTSSNDYINRVQLGSIDNTPAGTGSNSGPSYTDYYSSTNTSIQAGTSGTLTVTVGPYSGETVAAWIDYNADGDFDDAGEKIGEVTNVAASSTAVINFTIPQATAASAKRMRVRTVYSTTGLTPCDNYSFGEAEDYKITVTPACVTPGVPPTPTASAVTSNSATFSWGAETPLGSTTVTYSWALGTSNGITYESGYLQRGVTTSPTRTTGALTGLNPGTVYYLVVKASTNCDNTVSAYSSAGNCTTSCVTPTVPASLTTSDIATTSATLNWAASTGSPTVTYYWAVNTSATVNYESSYIQRGTTTSTSIALSGLTSNTNYTWTVKAVTNCGAGSSSAYASSANFKTTNACTTPSTPTLAAATNVASSSATINWSASVSGSPTITYYWAVNTSSTVDYESNYILNGTTTSLSAALTGLSNATTYYYKVKAVTSCNSSASAYQGSANSFTTTCTTPGTPASLSTTGITNSSITANWAASTGSPTITYSWAIKAGATPAFNGTDDQSGIVSGTSVNISGLTSNTAYKWSVKAYTDCGAGSSSSAAAAVNCTTSVSCSTPSVPASLTASGIANTSATINWAASTGSPAISYSWAVGTGSNVTYEANYTARGITSGISTSVSGLTANTIYYYTVKASTSCDNTVSAYAVANNFTTICTTPSTPTITGTSNVSTTSATLNWTASSGSPTITYYWAVGTSASVTYESGYTDRGTTTNTSATSAVLSSNTAYYWTVKAVTDCDNSASTYPLASGFTTTAIPTPLITWNGATSTDWNVTTNWTPNQLPTITDNVVIPNGCPRYPVITADNLLINAAGGTGTDKKCKSLHITGNNASVTINANGTTDDPTTSTAAVVKCNGVLNIAGTFAQQAGSWSNLFYVYGSGVVTVKNGGILSVGSSAIASGKPSGTINKYNDLKINDGSLTIENGGKVFVMDNLILTGTANVRGKLTMAGGELWVKYDGGGGSGTATQGFNADANTAITVSAGDVYVCGQTTTVGANAIAWNASSNINITGGNITLLNKQGTGADNDMTLDFGGKTINNLINNRAGKTSTIASNYTLTGDITNTDGTLTQSTGTATLTGTNNTIGGKTMSFNNLTLPSGANYTLNSSNGYVSVNGNFNLNTGATFLTQGNNMAISLAGTTNNIAGTFNASNPFDGTREIGLNGTGATLTITGNVNADVQVSSNSTTIGNSCTINGDLLANTGTLTLANGTTLTLNGSFTNNGTFNAGTGTIVFNSNDGSGTISGSVNNTAFNHVVFPQGSNYTWNPGTASGHNFDINGSFTNNGTITIAANRFIDIYSATAESESITLNGTITALSLNDNVKDMDINNTVSLSSNGTINADIRIYDGTTTLTSDFTTGGDVMTYDGATTPALTMTTQTLTVGGSWSFEGGTFNCGTSGKVVFNGAANRTFRTGSTQDGAGTISGNFFRNLTVDMGSSSVNLTMDRKGTDDNTNGLRVQGDFVLTTGVLSTGGNAYIGRKIRLDKLTLIETNGTLNIGGNSSTESGYGAWISEVRGDFMVHGNVTTTRPTNSGFAEIFFYGARVAGDGDVNEINVDIQTHSPSILDQIGDVYIGGDLITQTAGIYRCQNTQLLTVGGVLYVYNKFAHRGTVTCYKHFRDQSPTYKIAVNGLAIDSSTFNFTQTGTQFISFDLTNMPVVPFGQVNVITSGGTREFRNDISCKNDLTIQSGATADVTTSNRNITMSGNNASFYNNGTINLRSNTVSFTGNDNQVIGGSTATTFYNLTVNKSGGSELTLAKSATVSNTLTLTNGYVGTTANRLLTLTAGSSVSGGSVNSFVRGPVKKIGNTAFTFPLGKNTRWARLAIGAPATATTEFTAEYFEAAYSDVTSLNSPITQVSAKEYWILNRAVTTDAATVQLFWEDAAWSGINSCAANGNLVVARYNGTKWDSHGSPSASGSCSGSSAGTITSSSVSNFSPFTFGSKTVMSNPLPVSWLNFEATPKTKQVLLNWATGSEINSSKFYIQRSLDGITFTTIDSLNASGYAISATHYNGIDNNPHQGLNFYRIKQTDIDGAYTYSRIAVVDYAYYEAGHSISASILYPNPTIGNVNLAVTSSIHQKAQLTVFGLDGRLYINKEITLESGNNQLIIDSEVFAQGIYLINLQVTGQVINHKLVKK